LPELSQAFSFEPYEDNKDGIRVQKISINYTQEVQKTQQADIAIRAI